MQVSIILYCLFKFHVFFSSLTIVVMLSANNKLARLWEAKKAFLGRMHCVTAQSANMADSQGRLV